MKKIFTYLFLGLSPFIMSAQSGVLDTDFGQNGFVVDSFSNDYDAAERVIVQPDGKIIIIGDTGSGNSQKIAMARYNQDGSADTDFVNEGKLTFDVTMPKGFAKDGVIQPDGKIILGGYQWDNTTGDFVLVRLDNDGNFDSSFGDNGILILDNGMSEVGSSIYLQHDGKIIIAGDSDDQFTMARVNSDGSMDTTFGESGWVRTLFPIWSYVQDVHVHNSGEILLTGMTVDTNNDWKIALAKYQADGSIDTSFGNNGMLILGVGNDYDYGIRGILLDDGKILVGSHSYFGTNPLRYEVVATRLNSDGTIDASYGTNGNTQIRWTESGENYINDMVLQNDGKLIIAGRNSDATGDYFSIAKLDENGEPDASFGDEGKISGNVGSTADTATSVALQSDGKVVITGYTANFTDPTTFFIARYTNETLSAADFSKTELRLYPNPATHEIHLDWNALNTSEAVFEIFDSTGRKIMGSLIGNTKTITISSLASGVYTLKVTNDGNTFTRKFIKK